MKKSFLKGGVAVLIAICFLAGATRLWGQAGSSTIRGTVTDQTGAVIPNAKVTMTNLKTNLTRSQNTTATGTFSFDLIPPGEYKIEVEITGFRKKIINQVQALVGSVADANVQMDVGELSSVVMVEATQAVVQVSTQDATLGNNFVSTQIIQLPLEARNVQALLTLQPNVTGSPQANGYVAGARSDQSNITLDGVDINEAQTNALGTPVLRLNAEAIEEFRVTTVNANASQGRSSAAQVNLVTKSGSNSFHGSAFEYHRNTIFTANDFFNNRANPRVPRPKLIRNTFGGSVGGPVMKDRLFFFYSYEGRTDAKENSVTRTVPRSHLGQGQLNLVVANCSTCPSYSTSLTAAQLGTIFPAVGLNAAALTTLGAAAASYPVNDPSVGDGVNTGGYRFNFSTPNDFNSNVAKMDWTINSNMSASFRVNAIYDLQVQLPNFPDTPSPNRWDHPWGGVASHNWTIGRNWVNSFRYGYTRQAFSDQGDSAENAITFRFVFSPRQFTPRTLDRTTPVHNIVNDTSWTRGNHNVQFGTNIRMIGNSRDSFGGSFDAAVTNPSGYAGGGAVLSTPIRSFLRTTLAQPSLIIVSNSSAQNASTAMIGRYSGYAANYLYDKSGSLLSAGTPSARTFATQEYDLYVMDTWKWTRNVTLTLGLRYGISRPVYETGGFETKPNIPLDQFFADRLAAAAAGQNLATLLTIDLSGPANDATPMYRWDKNNFQPRVAVAWTPSFENTFLRRVFGGAGKSSIRAGFAMTNDYYGSQLAVAFDANNTLGFSSSTSIPVNTYNVTTRPAPLFTGFNQNVRTLPLITPPGPLTFPQTKSALSPTGSARRIESSLDEGLVAPLNYLVNLSVERELPHGFVVQGAYVGRLGRKLLATRDVMAMNNLVDTVSGVDWYTAATQLEILRQTGAAPNTIAAIPWFENVLGANFVADAQAFFYSPANGYAAAANNTQMAYIMAYGTDGSDGWGNDWTDSQVEYEQILGRYLWFQPQWGALSSWGTIANSNYHSLAFSVRQRMRGFIWDFNYTFSHSLDDASGLQTSGTYGAAFILNPIKQRQSYANSDFDIRHQMNLNAVYEFPFGKGKAFFSGVHRGVDHIIGGWQLSGIFRWNTGLPLSAPFDDVRWATNWNVQSSTVPTQAIPKNCDTRGTATVAPKLFGCDLLNIYHSFRNAYPGESGSRNIIRRPGYANVDLGLAKRIRFTEQVSVQLRWEVFNVANLQTMGGLSGGRTGFGMGLDPALNNLTPPSDWTTFNSIQGTPRVMQIGARIEF